MTLVIWMMATAYDVNNDDDEEEEEDYDDDHDDDDDHHDDDHDDDADDDDCGDDNEEEEDVIISLLLPLPLLSQNALESYTLSLSALWLGSVFAHPVPASLLYGGYLVGRERSFWGYCQSADKRLPSLYFCHRCIMGLGVLILVGVGNSMSRYYLDTDIAHFMADRLTFLKF
ncbi:microsomal glutathione S-transferase 2 [Elysia marginata]|uniref:Microsomal glutathione S-transferase 2 n=1 Tax=Elysia marginata TaxID=1093978 RepID=A0AAV4EED9_9GAST|nr:microsomal glutathione S-transferase 2 [Elysia marginata]